MRLGFARTTGRPAARQRSFSFDERASRRERAFKRAIVAATMLAVAGALGASAGGRRALGMLLGRARLGAIRLVGLEPSRDEVEATIRARRADSVGRTRASLVSFERGADPALRRLFKAAGMDPARGLIGSGRATNAFLLSADVFAPDPGDRTYRLLPGRRSIWLRQITIRGGPFSLFLVPDTPEVRAAADAAGAIVDEGSAQATNSWGLRGPEPDPHAESRLIVLGDSFMQGMFVGDGDTPPLQLERRLRATWKGPVSVLNTGHIGYAPRQYFASLLEYGERFRPDFVVVSVCPNDFGDENEVMAGRGEAGEWDEAGYWLGRVVQWCRSRSVQCLLVPIPCDVQVAVRRHDGRYPGQVCELFEGSSSGYCDPLDQFIDEHLRLVRAGAPRGTTGPLYNSRIGDSHFSPAGAALWAEIVARRVDLLRRPPTPAGALDPRP